MRKIVIFLMTVFLFYHCLFAVSIDTTKGANLDKSITVTYLYKLDATDTQSAFGSVMFTQGLRITGTGSAYLALNFPIQKQLNLRGLEPSDDSSIHLKKDLHLAEGTIIYCADGNYNIIRSDPGEHWTIYLDGDVTISGEAQSGPYSVLDLINVDLDGQGHTLNLGYNAQSGGLILSGRTHVRNITIKNCWNRYFDGTGSFLYMGVELPLSENSAIFENVNFIARRGMPMAFLMYGFYAPWTYIIKGTTTFGNFGEYYLLGFAPDGQSFFVIEPDSTLIVKDSTFTSGIWAYSSPSEFRPIRFWFKSDTSRIILDNSTFENNNNTLELGGGVYLGDFDQTVTLTTGTLVVRGASQLLATTDLSSPNRRAAFRLGDGIDPANDFNIVIEPGATLDVVASNTNSSIIFQNVH